MVYDEQSQPFMALEAQLSPMTADDAIMRTDRYARDGVAVCWVALEKRPWQRIVPSLPVRSPTERGQVWTVRHGMPRYTWAPCTLQAKAKWTQVTCSLGVAVGWILGGRVMTRTGADGTVWWTVPAYTRLAVERAWLEAEAEDVERAVTAERLRQEAEERARQAEQRRREAEERAAAAEQERQAELRRLAGFCLQAGMDAVVWDAFKQMVRSASGKADFYGEQSPALLTATDCLCTPGRDGKAPILDCRRR
jgi:competence protein CoiA